MPGADILTVAMAALEHPHGAKKIYFADIRRLAQAVIDLNTEVKDLKYLLRRAESTSFSALLEAQGGIPRKPKSGDLS